MLIQIKTNNNDITLTAEKPALIKLSRNFTLAEMANNAGDPTKPQYIISEESDAFITALQAFRNIVNERVIINSGYRQPDYNKKIGGDPNSRHKDACAADIQPIPEADEKGHINSWLEALAEAGQRGAINIYPDRSYYHLETAKYSYSKLLTIRVYKDEALYNVLYSYYFSPYIAVQRF